MLAAQRLVEHDPERVEIGPLVDRGAAQLLGRHVAHRADRQPAAGHPGEAAHARDPEVHELHLRAGTVLIRPVPVRQVDVGGLDVAMNDARCVRRREPVAEAAHDREQLRRRHRPDPPEPHREVLALEQLHREVERPIVELPDLADLHDGRVLHHRERGALAPEALHRAVVVGQLPAHELQGDAGVGLEIDGLEHLAHTALSELALEAKARPDDHASGVGRSGGLLHGGHLHGV